MKYQNIKTNGYASRREAKRATELAMLQRAGHISELREQVRYQIIPKQDGERPAYYVADFVFMEDGQLVVEDVKGMKTTAYILKRKLMKLVHGITIKEV